MYNDKNVSLSLISNILQNELKLDTHPDLNIYDLQNFLDPESKQALEEMICDYLNCGAMDTDHVILYDKVRFAYGEEDFFAGINKRHKGESEEIRKKSFLKLKENILDHIRNEFSYLQDKLSPPILLSPKELANKLISAIEIENKDFHAIYDAYYFCWRDFCQNYIRIYYFWKTTGALIYGPHQREQMK